MTETKIIDEYIDSHSDDDGEYLHRLWRATNIHTVHGRMVSGHLQGRLLKMFVNMIHPHYILEIGTFSGYSAICMAEGLAEVSKDTGDTKRKIYTYEINDEMEDFARQWIGGSSVAEWIKMTIGDAKDLAPKLGIKFDMAFVDGNKRTYKEDYEMVLGVLAPGGYILADNTLWDGHVVDPSYDNDQQTKSIKEFNDFIKEDNRVEKVMLPLRDGLTIIRKKISAE
nr:class I SAM-dependent methyltransferase [Prevotella sp.]